MRPDAVQTASYVKGSAFYTQIAPSTVSINTKYMYMRVKIQVWSTFEFVRSQDRINLGWSLQSQVQRPHPYLQGLWVANIDLMTVMLLPIIK